MDLRLWRVSRRSQLARCCGRSSDERRLAEPEGAFLTVFSISPLQGSIAGGTEASIQGTGFRPGLVVSFGDKTVHATVGSDPSSIVVITPSHDKGIVDVKVSLNGRSAVLPNGFDYD